MDGIASATRGDAVSLCACPEFGSRQAIILADADLDIVNYEVEVTFPSGSSTNKAGLVFAVNLRRTTCRPESGRAGRSGMKIAAEA